MPHDESYYYAAYFAAIGIYTLYTMSVWKRRQTVALRRIALRRER
ncbi:MAG: hypothetical protein JWO39_1773 [Gemmatimonadetes bacterium]|jgi:hypothetical protein|nr:hypothetical protein [Gemmatimonadota bacterium]